MADCIGHFGYIDLELPVFHVGFFRAIIQVLQCVCKECSCILLNPSVAAAFRERIKDKGNTLSYLSKKALRKRIIETCKKSSSCPSCGAINGVVKKCGLLKISHEKYRNAKKFQSVINERLAEYDEVLNRSGGPGDPKEMQAMINSTGLVHVLNPLEVLQIFTRIPDEDVSLLLMDDKAAGPASMILTRIPVPPLCIRPSVISDLKSGTNEDDITIKLTEIVFLNDVINKHKQSGATAKLIQDDWDFLQLQCALHFNSQVHQIMMMIRLDNPDGD